MKNTILFILAMLVNHAVLSQFTIQGTVRDKQTQKGLPKAILILDDNSAVIETDISGVYMFNNILPGKHRIEVRYVGYQTLKIEVTLTESKKQDFNLEQQVYDKEPVEITAIRANEKSAMAYTDISKSEIEKINTGKDIPYLLESVPSLVPTSDAGTGIGYTGVRLRGSDASRINVTIDGIPINDSESQLLYWVNMPDLAASINNIQVQRGVGTSTNGAAAFGGSINIQTNKPSAQPYLTTSGAYGNFNTFKSNASIGTGMLNNNWNFEGRLSKITSDGYIDRASSDLKSIYIAGGYYGKKNIVKMKVFSGKEITYQSWYGLPESSLDTNRTWNYYTYENQVDNYQQDHYQLFYTHAFNERLQINTAFHYTYGRGYYEEYKEDELLSDYNLLPVVTGSDTIINSNLIRRKWLNNDFYGATFSAKYDARSRLSIIAGGAWNQYDGDHYGEVIWSQFASNGFINNKYYDNSGLKTDLNVYGKITTGIISRLSGFIDLQYRTVKYDFTGYDDTGIALPQSQELHFFNPKAGLTYTVDPLQYGYISYSIGNKEPSRDDYTESSNNSRPRPERLYDIEAGYQLKTDKFTFGFNYFLMLYDNQLVLTGEINDVGNYTRTNIKKSYRKGLELEGGWNVVKNLTFAGNLTISKNKIKEFRQYTDDYDNATQVLQIYTDTDIAFSPELTGFLSLGWNPVSNFEIQLVNRYVGEQFLDNTSNKKSILDPYFVSDLRFNYRLSPKFMKAVEFSFMINNLLDEMYESNGYAFSYFSGGEKTTENYYYPQAGRNVMGMVTLKF
ncbi:MAG: TonB-dependent receptor [Bacteroidota bacterium]|nr:TonB-dependent receptor [Bacteroidota bacterium]